MKIAPINEELLKKAQAAEEEIAPHVKTTEEIAFYNQRKVLQAFRQNQVSDFHLTG